MPTKKDRADRILILLALIVLLGSASLFYFDDWMWGARRRATDKIGLISSRLGDVRMKFTGDLKWQKAAGGQDLIYNDSIYVGENSEAHLNMGESEMTVSEKTLVVLRREKNTSFMNLSYGSLFGKISKNEHVVIDTGDGHPIDLHTDSASEVVIRKVAGKTELDVLSGDAEVKVGGQLSKLSRSSRLVVDKENAPSVQQIALELIHPLRSESFYSEQPGQVDFSWRWSSGQKAAANEKFAIDFSPSMDFTKPAMTREVSGHMDTQFKASQSINYFYRVRGPHGQVSAVGQVNFVRMHPPVVLQPRRDSVFQATAFAPAVVGLEIEKDKQAKVNYQISGTGDFKNILDAETLADGHAARSLPEGKYFLRAQADYGSNHLSSWSDPVAFSVETKLEPAPIGPELSEKTKVLIPNRDYPPDLYEASAQKTSSYLARHGLLASFFPYPVGSFDKLSLALETPSGEAQMIERTNPAWPAEKLKPGRYTFKYQVEKTGSAPSVWSAPKKLEIAMEPPHPVGTPSYGAADPDGVREGHWAFTPLLFAKSYDVELADNPRLKAARAIEVYKPEVVAKLKGENFYRVRARDSRGRLISDFSPIYKLEGGVPASLAQSAPPPRKPAAVENTNNVQIEVVHDQPFHKSGWWAWVGGGENYVDYKQSADGRLSFDDHHVKGMSEYIEAGFIGDQSIGGVVSFSFTPGEINPDNASIDHNDYTWTTVALEAFARKSALFNLFGNPVNVDIRAGIQQHTLPFVFVDAYGDVYLKNSEMTMASVGASAELRHERWTYMTMMRYQYPLTTRADGASAFSVSPVVSFDGSIGAAYNFTQRFKLGMFANGQLQEFNYSYSDGQVTNHGLQTIFFSNLDVRLGYEF